MWINQNGEPEAVAYKFGRRRLSAMLICLPIYAIVQAVYFFALVVKAQVDWGNMIGVNGTTLILLVMIARGFGHGRLRPEVRAILDDEVSRANRSAAQATGFWAAVAAAAAMIGVSRFVEMSGLQAAYLVVSLATLSASAHFILLERQALMGLVEDDGLAGSSV